MPNIDNLIDGLSGFKILSFIYAYFGYNQIKMNPLNVSKIMFMSNNYNYYYEDVYFVLNNACTTRLMDVIFSNQIEHNLEVFIDDMVVKTSEEVNQCINLEDILK